MFNRLSQKHPQTATRSSTGRQISDSESIEPYRSISELDLDEAPLGPVIAHRAQQLHNPVYAAEALQAAEHWNLPLLKVLLKTPRADVGQGSQLDQEDEALIQDVLRYVRSIRTSAISNVRMVLAQAFPQRYWTAILGNNNIEQLRPLLIEALNAYVDPKLAVDDKGNNLLHKAMAHPKIVVDRHVSKFLSTARFLFEQPGAAAMLFESNRIRKRPYDYVGALSNNELAEDVTLLIGLAKKDVDGGPAFHTSKALENLRVKEVGALDKAQEEIEGYRVGQLPKRDRNPFVRKKRTQELQETVGSLTLALGNARTAESWFMFEHYMTQIKNDLMSSLHPFEKSYLLNTLLRIEKEAKKLVASGEQPWHLTEQITQLLARNQELELELIATRDMLEREMEEKTDFKKKLDRAAQELIGAQNEIVAFRETTLLARESFTLQQQIIAAVQAEAAMERKQKEVAQAALAELRARELERQREQELATASLASNSQVVADAHDEDEDGVDRTLSTIEMELPDGSIVAFQGRVLGSLPEQASSEHNSVQGDATVPLDDADPLSAQEQVAAMQNSQTSEDDGLSDLDSLAEFAGTAAMVNCLYKTPSKTSSRAATPAPVQMAESFHSHGSWDSLGDELNGSSSQAASAAKKNSRGNSPSF